MVVGAPKCGSTSLFQYLAEHPSLQAHVHREMPFFGRDDEYGRGWSYAVDKYYDQAAAGGGAGTRPGPRLVAKHTMAMYDEASLHRIAASTSAVVVAVLRDPVARAYSHYAYAVLRGWEDARTFEEGLEREADRAVSRPPRARDLQYVGDGVFAPRVRALFDALPPQRRRVYTTADLRSDPQRVCAELFELAGLAPHQPDVATAHNAGRVPRSAAFARVFLRAQQPGSPLRAVASRFLPSRALYRARFLVNRLNEREAAVAPMTEATKSALRERFSGPDADLADLLGHPLPWRR